MENLDELQRRNNLPEILKKAPKDLVTKIAHTFEAQYCEDDFGLEIYDLPPELWKQLKASPEEQEIVKKYFYKIFCEDEESTDEESPLFFKGPQGRRSLSTIKETKFTLFAYGIDKQSSNIVPLGGIAVQGQNERKALLYVFCNNAKEGDELRLMLSNLKKTEFDISGIGLNQTKYGQNEDMIYKANISSMEKLLQLPRVEIDEKTWLNRMKPFKDENTKVFVFGSLAGFAAEKATYGNCSTLHVLGLCDDALCVNTVKAFGNGFMRPNFEKFYEEHIKLGEAIVVIPVQKKKNKRDPEAKPYLNVPTDMGVALTGPNVEQLLETKRWKIDSVKVDHFVNSESFTPYAYQKPRIYKNFEEMNFGSESGQILVFAGKPTFASKTRNLMVCPEKLCNNTLQDKKCVSRFNRSHGETRNGIQVAGKLRIPFEDEKANVVFGEVTGLQAATFMDKDIQEIQRQCQEHGISDIGGRYKLAFTKFGGLRMVVLRGRKLISNKNMSVFDVISIVPVKGMKKNEKNFEDQKAKTALTKVNLKQVNAGSFGRTEWHMQKKRVLEDAKESAPKKRKM